MSIIGWQPIGNCTPRPGEKYDLWFAEGLMRVVDCEWRTADLIREGQPRSDFLRPKWCWKDEKFGEWQEIPVRPTHWMQVGRP